MRKAYFILFLLVGTFTVSFAQDATLETLKTKKDQIKTEMDEKAAEMESLAKDLAAVEKEISVLSGWQTGLNGVIGFDLSKSNDWIASPNPNSSSSGLNIGVTAYANQEGRKAFWRNKLVVNKAWNDIDLSDSDDDADDDGLFDNGTVDVLNLSSLGGKKLNDWFALSALVEANTSVENFFSPGTVDFGIGATLTPIENLVVVIHPINYHLAFSGVDDVDSQGGLGAKFRADYTRDFLISSKKVAWSSTLTGFVPYGDKVEKVSGDPSSEVSLFEYTWLNSLSFEVWKGIGVGTTFGLRQSDFEFDGTQSFYSLGLSYNF